MIVTTMTPRAKGRLFAVAVSFVMWVLIFFAVEAVVALVHAELTPDWFGAPAPEGGP